MAEDTLQYNAFYSLLERIHMLFNIPFVIQYVEPKNADLLPISNNKNFELAVNSSKPLLRILLQRKGVRVTEKFTGINLSKHGLIHRGAADTLRNFGGSEKHRRSEKPVISVMSDFHLVSSILDVDIIPWTLRR
ncbi:partitioning defective protein 6 [Schistosoma bovis]|uniref:Partitioning defective protein 6 n=1 Tax=Schistosoma bovis TaxID=6184 RepID=A0A430QTH8_SCHBO|nr:partitioning defective protein 6 [Schistosoma bovis]